MVSSATATTPRIPSPPLAPAQREEKFVTHDGPIWPFARHLMQNVDALRRRMAEDVADLVAAQAQDPTVSHDDLTRLGWTRGQVLAHGDHAIRAAMRVE